MHFLFFFWDETKWTAVIECHHQRRALEWISVFRFIPFQSKYQFLAQTQTARKSNILEPKKQYKCLLRRFFGIFPSRKSLDIFFCSRSILFIYFGLRLCLDTPKQCRKRLMYHRGSIFSRCNASTAGTRNDDEAIRNAHFIEYVVLFVCHSARLNVFK